MAGSLGLFDSVQLTASSEYSSRRGEDIDTLQIHHATMTSLSGLIGLMQPGGRQVSANGALSNTGHLVEVVPLNMRAFTSASGFDRRCLTVECCNTSLSPNWGISEATHRRLAKLAVDMFRAGILGSLTRRHIIGHYEVPGTYATSCPGPSMDLDRIVSLAVQMNAAPAGGGFEVIEEFQMAQVQYYERKEPGFGPEWMIGGIDLRGGFETTTDIEQAKLWSRQYADAKAPIALDRATYIKTQQWLARHAAQQQSAFVDRLKSALG